MKINKYINKNKLKQRKNRLTRNEQKADQNRNTDKSE